VNELETKFIIEGEVSEVRNPGIPSASANSIRSSDENEVEERSVETELAEDSIRVIRENEGGINLLVGESLLKRQQEDPDVGTIVRRRLMTEEVPTCEELEAESETTKKLATKWESLEVFGDLVYRRSKSPKCGEPDSLQLQLPQTDVEHALRECHAGVTAGHFGIQKTLYQVKRRFYWPSWKEDTKRFCHRCAECNEYHRGKLKKQGALKPVLPGAPYERWYIDLAGPHPKSNRGHIWILTCIDSFSKCPKLFHFVIKRQRPSRRS